MQYEFEPYKSTIQMSKFTQPPNIYKPEKYDMYRCSGSKAVSYHIGYDDYEFHITDRPDESYPDTFAILHQGKEIMTDKYLLPELFYKTYPNDYDELMHNELLSVFDMIERCKLVFGEFYNDKLSFGMYIMRHWILAFYKCQRSDVETVNICRMFLEQSEDNDDDDKN